MIFWRVKPLDQILENAEKKSLKRQLGALQLTMLGIGAIIGTGIFVLTAEAAQKAGPGMMVAFVIAAVVCGRMLSSSCNAVPSGRVIAIRERLSAASISAAAARCCERSAIASSVARSMPSSSAWRSAAITSGIYLARAGIVASV